MIKKKITNTGNIEIVKMLLKNGADVNAKSTYDGTPANILINQSK